MRGTVPDIVMIHTLFHAYACHPAYIKPCDFSFTSSRKFRHNRVDKTAILNIVLWGTVALYTSLFYLRKFDLVAKILTSDDKYAYGPSQHLSEWLFT